MSTCIVEVCTVEKIEEHPNADRLEILFVKGWQCVTQKGIYAIGDKVLYIPVDSVIPPDIAEKLGIVNYLSNGRVMPVRLRGIPSYGVLMPSEGKPEGINLAEELGITQYVPPERDMMGDAAPPHQLFFDYTEIENLRNYPNVFKEGEIVSVTEKIHGTNCRLGYVRDVGGAGIYVAGSMHVRRKEPEDYLLSTYWKPLANKNIKNLLDYLIVKHYLSSHGIIIYGEIYGPGVQNLNYDLKLKSFAVFDIRIGQNCTDPEELLRPNFMDPEELYSLCDEFEVNTVPRLYTGPFSLDKIRELSSGKSTIASHMREGCVIKSIKEEFSLHIGGRKILKYIGDEYMLSKNKRGEKS